MRQTCVVLRSFWVRLSLYYQIKLCTMGASLSQTMTRLQKTIKTAFVLNEFFSNIVTTLVIPQYNETEPVSHNISDSLIKAIVKYRFHPSIVAMQKNCNSDLSFSFSQVERDEIMKKITKLKINKATQSTDIPTKLVKKNSDIFGDFIFENYNCFLFCFSKLPKKCNYNTSS